MISGRSWASNGIEWESLDQNLYAAGYSLAQQTRANGWVVNMNAMLNAIDTGTLNRAYDESHGGWLSNPLVTEMVNQGYSRALGSSLADLFK